MELPWQWLGCRRLNDLSQSLEDCPRTIGSLYDPDCGPDRKLFYSEPPSNLGMKEGTNGAESRIQQLKDKFDLDEMVGNTGVSWPSLDIKEYIRVLRLARKPDREEFMMIAKVSIAGIALIGIMGFLIYVLLTQVPKAIVG